MNYNGIKVFLVSSFSVVTNGDVDWNFMQIVREFFAGNQLGHPWDTTRRLILMTKIDFWTFIYTKISPRWSAFFIQIYGNLTSTFQNNSQKHSVLIYAKRMKIYICPLFPSYFFAYHSTDVFKIETKPAFQIHMLGNVAKPKHKPKAVLKSCYMVFRLKNMISLHVFFFFTLPFFTC